MFTVNEIVERHLPQVSDKPWLNKPTCALLRYLLHEREVNDFGERYPFLQGLDFVEQVLEYFNVSYSVRDNEKENIPSNGRLVIISNHPIGSNDGLALIKLVSEIRQDLKVVANDMLMTIKPLQEMLLPVNNMQGCTPKENLRNIDAHLANEGVLLIFPAGEVSRLRPSGVKDTYWHSGFIRMARKAKAPILPIFIDAKNSPFFYGVSMIYKPLATLLLVKEMFNQRKNHFPIRIGQLIPYQSYAGSKVDINQLTKLFKKHLYRINTKKPEIFASQKAIALPEDRQALKKAIKQHCKMLGETADGKLMYLYEYQSSSPIMREIGRLREVSFRAVGEGSYNRRDVDQYDKAYFHLILWDQDDLEIVGAYRFGDASKLAASNMLYSATLFEYQAPMSEYFAQGLELGRSFVQPKYWGKRSLDYLWFGIGAFLKAHPQFRYLFGPVSMSDAFPPIAKDLMVEFYQAHFSAEQTLAVGKMPFQYSDEKRNNFAGEDYKAEFTILKNMLGNMNIGVPTLYKQYAELCEPGGVKFLNFNVDPDFNDCVDGLVLVDIEKLKEKKRKRYLGNS